MVLGLPHVLVIPGAWLFMGTYPAPFKSPAVLKADTDPFILQCFKSACVCLTSWLILTWRPFTFTYLGFVGAACWVPAGLSYITAVKLCGVAFVTPVATGLQVVVSFCWGKFYFHEPTKNIWLTLLAMLIMFVGMMGISYACNYEKLLKQKEARLAPSINVRVAYDAEVIAAPGADEAVMDETTPIYVNKPLKQAAETEMRNTVLGLILAVVCALTGGSMNVPLKRAPPDAHGIQYVISFGIGAVAITAFLTILYTVIRLAMGMGPPKVNLRVSFIPATCAGLLWSAGNICQIYAVLLYGVTIGTPLVQCNMMIAGCWGVFYFNEAPRTSMKLFFVGSCGVLLGGVVLLSLYG